MFLMYFLSSQIIEAAQALYQICKKNKNREAQYRKNIFICPHVSARWNVM